MKWYRTYSLAVIIGCVSGSLYHKSKEDTKLRKTLVQIALASLCYTSFGFAATSLIPRFRAGCSYYTLTALVTSSNFLFTRQFLLEKEWVYRQDLSPRQNLCATSAVTGAETGFIVECILAEGGVISTVKAMGYWSAVAVVFQLCMFLVEAWRIRKSLQLHSPELFPQSEGSSPERAVQWLDRVIQQDWKIDTIRRENDTLNLRILREVDRLRQAKAVLNVNNIPFDKSQDTSDD